MRTEHRDQASFCPFAPREVSVLAESYAGGDPNSKPVHKLVPEGGNLTQQVNEYSDVRAKMMTSGGKETKDSGYATRGPQEKLDQVTGKPTVTI